VWALSRLPGESMKGKGRNEEGREVAWTPRFMTYRHHWYTIK